MPRTLGAICLEEGQEETSFRAGRGERESKASSCCCAVLPSSILADGGVRSYEERILNLGHDVGFYAIEGGILKSMDVAVQRLKAVEQISQGVPAQVANLLELIPPEIGHSCLNRKGKDGSPGAQARREVEICLDPQKGKKNGRTPGIGAVGGSYPKVGERREVWERKGFKREMGRKSASPERVSSSSERSGSGQGVTGGSSVTLVQAASPPAERELARHQLPADLSGSLGQVGKLLCRCLSLHPNLKHAARGAPPAVHFWVEATITGLNWLSVRLRRTGGQKVSMGMGRKSIAHCHLSGLM